MMQRIRPGPRTPGAQGRAWTRVGTDLDGLVVCESRGVENPGSGEVLDELASDQLNGSCDLSQPEPS